MHAQMDIRIDDTNEFLEISKMYVGILLRADHIQKQMIVCERDGEILFKTTMDGGKSWTDFREIEIEISDLAFDLVKLLAGAFKIDRVRHFIGEIQSHVEKEFTDQLTVEQIKEFREMFSLHEEKVLARIKNSETVQLVAADFPGEGETEYATDKMMEEMSKAEEYYAPGPKAEAMRAKDREQRKKKGLID